MDAGGAAFGPEDVLLQKTPYTFDVSVWECSGGPAMVHKW